MGEGSSRLSAPAGHERARHLARMQGWHSAFLSSAARPYAASVCMWRGGCVQAAICVSEDGRLLQNATALLPWTRTAAEGRAAQSACMNLTSVPQRECSRSTSLFCQLACWTGPLSQVLRPSAHRGAAPPPPAHLSPGRRLQTNDRAGERPASIRDRTLALRRESRSQAQGFVCLNTRRLACRFGRPSTGWKAHRTGTAACCSVARSASKRASPRQPQPAPTCAAKQRRPGKRGGGLTGCRRAPITGHDPRSSMRRDP